MFPHFHSLPLPSNPDSLSCAQAAAEVGVAEAKAQAKAGIAKSASKKEQEDAKPEDILLRGSRLTQAVRAASTFSKDAALVKGIIVAVMVSGMSTC